MTEADAKTKQCCGPWLVSSCAVGAEMVSHGQKVPRELGLCVTSACMAWRAGAKIDAGYCGLAGRPE